MLERADRQQLVVLAGHLAEIAFDQSDPVIEPATHELGAKLGDLFGGRIDAGAQRAVALPCVEQQAAPAAADVDEGFAALELHLATDMIHLVLLRFLQRLRALLPVCAGVHHADAIEPELVESLAQPVVKPGVGLGLRDRLVGKTEFVPAVAHRDQRVVRVVEARIECGAEREREIAFDVEVAVEIGFEQADRAESEHAQCRARGPERGGELRGLPLFAIGVDRAVGKYRAESDRRRSADRGELAADQAADAPVGRAASVCGCGDAWRRPPAPGDRSPWVKPSAVIRPSIRPMPPGLRRCSGFCSAMLSELFLVWRGQRRTRPAVAAAASNASGSLRSYRGCAVWETDAIGVDPIRL